MDPIDKGIQQHRTGEITLTITDPSGRLAANARVVIEMLRHKFLFGCNAYALDQCGLIMALLLGCLSLRKQCLK